MEKATQAERLAAETAEQKRVAAEAEAAAKAASDAEAPIWQKVREMETKKAAAKEEAADVSTSATRRCL